MAATRKIIVEGDDLGFSAAHIATAGGEAEPLHGHSYRVRVVVEGELSGDAWVFDFRELERLVRAVCVELDHRFLLQTASPVIQAREQRDSWEIVAGHRRYLLPKSDVVALPLDNLTAERLAEWVCRRLLDQIRPTAANVSRVSVGIEEGPGQVAWHSEELERYS